MGFFNQGVSNQPAQKFAPTGTIQILLLKGVDNEKRKRLRCNNFIFHWPVDFMPWDPGNS